MSDSDTDNSGDNGFERLQIEAEKELMQGDIAFRADQTEAYLAHYSKAITFLKQSIEILPQEACSRIRLAKALEQIAKNEDDLKVVLKELEESEKLLKENKSQHPLNKFDGKDEILLIRGKCYFVLNNKEAATQNLQKALEINKDLGEAKWLLNKIASQEEEKPKSGGCFVVTATYGDALAPEVIYLKSFRENILRPSGFGRTLISFYEKVSPRIANIVAKYRILRFIIRTVFLAPLIAILRNFH